jgi:hypothetical protein
MTKFKKARTLKDIKNDPRVESISDERNGWNNDGIWIYLKYPYWDSCSETSAVHEFTVAECLEVFNHYVEQNPNY